MAKIIFKNVFLINEDRLTNILFDGKQITYIKAVPKDYEGTIYDLDKRIVFRGFADPHTHLDKALIAEKVENKSGTLKEAIEIMSHYKKTMTDQDILERMDKVIGMAYKNGTRFIRTHLDIDEKLELRSLNILNEMKEKYPEMVIEAVAFPQEGILKNKQNFELIEDALKAGVKVLGGIPAMDLNPNE